MSTASTEATSAPAQLPGIRDVSKVAAGTYKLEPDHTQVLFTFNHLGFTDYTGQFVQPSGSLTIEPAAWFGLVANDVSSPGRRPARSVTFRKLQDQCSSNRGFSFQVSALIYYPRPLELAVRSGAGDLSLSVYF